MVGRRIGAAAVALLAGVLCGCTAGIPNPGANVALPPTSPAIADGRPIGPGGPVGVDGLVTTPGGAPVGGALVTLRGGGTEGCGRCGHQLATRTDAAGGFSLAVPQGSYLLACTTPDATVCRLSPAVPLIDGRLEVRDPMRTLDLIAPPARPAQPRPAQSR